MPFCKVPAPVYHQYGTATKALTATTHTNDVIANGTGARRIRAPLRHSVDGAPPPTSGIPSTTARQNFRSSYADPAVANGADPYVKTSARDLSNGGCSGRPVLVGALTSSLRPETARLISNSVRRKLKWMQCIRQETKLELVRSLTKLEEFHRLIYFWTFR